MPTPVSACVIIDTSASMSYSGYVTNTVIDSKAFLSYALPGDAIGAVNYDVNGNNCYAPSGALAVVDSTLAQVAAAATAVNSLSFLGNCTNIGGGIQSAYALLAASSVTPKAAVLLTDGNQNCGTDPLSVPPTFPIYACAMGPATNTALLQNIATRTNGLYYYMPYPINMMTIYNQIRASQPRAQGVVNYLSQLSPSQQTLLIPANIAAGSDTNQIGVVWDNTAYQYTSSNAPGANQISITLYQPDNSAFQGTPSVTGAGYVIFDVPNPMIGTWNAFVLYSGAPGGLNVTTGVFEFAASGAREFRLDVTPAGPVAEGGKLVVDARLMEEDEPIAIESMHAEVTSPTLSVANALDRHADELKSMSYVADEADHPDDRPETRLAALHRLWLPHHDLMPHRTIAMPMAAQEDGAWRVAADAAQAGSHNVIVRAVGYSERSKTRVQRTQLVTIPVEAG